MEVEVSNVIRLFGDTRSGSQGPKFSSLPARTLHTKMGLQWDPEMDANPHYYGLVLVLAPPRVVVGSVGLLRISEE